MDHLLRKHCKPRTGQFFTAGGRDYEMGGKIGNGAVGLVRKARDRQSGRVVALKLLAPDPKYIDRDAFEDVAHRFRREGERGAGLTHDHLVKVLAYSDNSQGEAFTARSANNPFVVMEYVRGRSLESMIRKAPGGLWLTAQTLSIAVRIADALVYLHRRKIVHRDVKPANVFLSSAAVGPVPNEVKLGDFGVTKWGDFLGAMASGTLTTATQKGLGTLKYMSPEQALTPKDVGVRSDMYSFGITLYELFTARILASPHHVFEVGMARHGRGSAASRMFKLGYNLEPWQADILEVVLDMFLNSAAGRPTSAKARGRLDYYYDRLSEAAAV